jgi:hypothetical protein
MLFLSLDHHCVYRVTAIMNEWASKTRNEKQLAAASRRFSDVAFDVSPNKWRR